MTTLTPAQAALRLNCSAYAAPLILASHGEKRHKTGWTATVVERIAKACRHKGKYDTKVA